MSASADVERARRPRRAQLPDPDRPEPARRREQLRRPAAAARLRRSSATRPSRRSTPIAWPRRLRARYAKVDVIDRARRRGAQGLADAADDLRRAGRRRLRPRHDRLFALGGGVVGDLAGFAAACYMRGVAYVQVPTTLLAQVDSSVGGKTAINHPLGQEPDRRLPPAARWSSPTSTRSTRCRSASWSPGWPRSSSTARSPTTRSSAGSRRNLAALLARDKAALGARGDDARAEIKAEVVASDEREAGLRAILNFGHTFAHAIETGTGHGTWLHGEAVGCGMAMAADLSARLGLVEPAQAERIARVAARGRAALARAARSASTRYLELMRHGQEGARRPDALRAARRSWSRPACAWSRQTPVTATIENFCA